jgi:hypothetical protein
VYLEQWIKTGDRQWEVREYESHDTGLILASVDLQISMTDLYDKVEFDLIR